MEEVTEEPVTENEAKETDKFLIKNRESPTETCLTQESRHRFFLNTLYFFNSLLFIVLILFISISANCLNISNLKS